MDVEIILPAASGLVSGVRLKTMSGNGRRLRPARVVFHSVAFIWFMRVIMWHFTPEASLLPGAIGFGWFFRYLTMCSFFLQTFAMGICILDDLHSRRLEISRKQGTPRSQLASKIHTAADDLSCALFAFANVVTIMYHVLEAVTHNMSEGADQTRPPWLNSSTHVLNCIVAWADLLLAEQRSFSASSRNLTAGLAATYLSWLLLCRKMNGKFPYPFMNKLPFPAGYLGISAMGIIILVALFQTGKAINHLLQRVRRRFLSATAVKHKVM